MVQFWQKLGLIQSSLQWNCAFTNVIKTNPTTFITLQKKCTVGAALHDSDSEGIEKCQSITVMIMTRENWICEYKRTQNWRNNCKKIVENKLNWNIKMNHAINIKDKWRSTRLPMQPHCTVTRRWKSINSFISN